MAARPAEAAAEDEGWDAGEAGAAEPQLPARILTQDEIDSLLGLSLSEEEDAGRTGLRAIINSTLVPYERLPALRAACARLARLMTTSLTNFTSDTIEVSLERISSIRFGDYLSAVPAPAVIAVFRTGQHDNCGLIGIDSALICSVVDALMGRRRGGAPAQVEGRAGAAIEHTLVTRMIEVVLGDARQAFAPLTDVAFNLERIDSDPQSGAIADLSSAALALKFRIDLDGRAGRLELLLPYAALEPIRHNLLQQGNGENRDTIWEGRLASELWAAKLEVRAVLAEFKQPLHKVLDLKVGDTLMLDALPDTPVKLRCGAMDLSVGRVGRRGHSLAVRVERPIAPAAQHAVMKRDGGS